MTAELLSDASIFDQVKCGLRSLGFKDELLREDYEFTDVFPSELLVRTVPLAAFYQSPPSYHSACFGVCRANGLKGPELVSEYRSLGARNIFEISPGGLSIWQMGNGVPRFSEFVETEQINNLFDKHQNDWTPNRLKDLKNMSYAGQLSFADIGLLPLLDGEVQSHFDALITRLINESISKHPSIKNEYRRLFRLIFRLITAKIMADRKHKGYWLHEDPRLAIKEVENYYFQTEIPEPVLSDFNVQCEIWRNIRNSFHFNNLSVDVLSYVYENTLMTPEFRKATGTHGTPPTIAEYIVRHIPFEEVNEAERYTFEPFGGHSVFLVAALRRLRDLLPTSVTFEQRHAYFKNMLSSMEIDEFAREVARIMLNNADYPNPDGWSLIRGDVFESVTLNNELSKANIVLCNPPFEEFTTEQKNHYRNLTSTHKPAEILNRILRVPPKALGFVLPRIFISGQGYSDIRKKIAKIYSDIEILALPDNVFRYSEADTVLLIASGEKNVTTHISVGQVYEKDLKKFYSSFQPSYKNETKIHSESDLTQYLWLPELGDIWDALAKFEKLGKYAGIHRGVKYNISIKDDTGREKVMSEKEVPNFAKGLYFVNGILEPYIIRSHNYLNVSSEYMYDNAYKLPWKDPKIIVNAFRRSRGHWRINAASDVEGLYCSQVFHGIWVDEDIPLEIVSAILNGPIANAYVSDYEITAKEIKARTLSGIPFPNLSKTQKENVIKLVKDYISTRRSWLNGDIDSDSASNACHKLLKRIDGEILNSYGLSAELSQRLLDYFTNYQRSGSPVKFTGYFSLEYSEQIKDLQRKINLMDLQVKGTVEERFEHKVEIMRGLENIRKRANTTKLIEG